MPMSNVQKGANGQFTFLANALATGKGQIEVYTPAADNEGRDAEVRRHLKSKQGISVQIKVAFSPWKRGGTGGTYLMFDVSMAADRIQNDPRLWYFFALYNVKELRFHNPVFLVPARTFHKIAREGKPSKGRIWFEIAASLAPASNDRWKPYRVEPSQLGKRLLEIIDDKPLTASGRAPQLPADTVWLARAA
jgi:hypothetical protein